MTNDPNSPNAGQYAYKLALSQYKSALDMSQAYAASLRSDLDSVINSKGWKILEKIRKLIPHSKHHISSPPPKKSLIPPSYISHYEDNIDYSKMGYSPEVKAIAFYLPQFHTFKENDQWWGKGFTEWTNTKKSIPRFKNHYQPREPHDDIGYYSLDNSATIKKQVNLAKQHGIHGFCFYYYWFSGKQLMNKPIDIFLDNKDIDFPFCLCWANENWTRTWDGLNKNILIEQKYKKNDPENFIKSIRKYIQDSRYIKINGNPVIMVYAPNSIPNFETVVNRWRDTAKQIGIGDLTIISKSAIFGDQALNSAFIDGQFDFAPTGCNFSNSVIEQNDEHHIFDYSALVEDYIHKKFYYHHFPVKPFYYSCTLGWDNSARRKNGYTVLTNYNPKSFYDWLDLIINETKRRFPPDERFIFINAWNEWAEGTYLEPDKKYGYTNINTASKAIYGLPFEQNDKTIVLDQSIPNLNNSSDKIAVQVHVFYLDVFNELIDNLAKIPYDFDLFISTNDDKKKEKISKLLSASKIKCKKIKIDVFDNIGRDIYPFLAQLSKIYKHYDIIGHFHTKKTLTQFYGDMWRNHLYNNLLGSTSNIKKIFSLFNQDPKIGIIAPTCFYVVRDGMCLHTNIKDINSILNKCRLHPVDKTDKFFFPVGTMFWARTSSVENIFALNFKASDFPNEEGQVDGTIAHALERLFGIIPEQKGYKAIQIVNKADCSKKQR